MRLDPDKLMFGVAPSILIDCAVQIHGRERDFDFDDFCEALGAPAEEAHPVLAKLVRAGLPSRTNRTFFGSIRPRSGANWHWPMSHIA
jgi:hypothetical protein